MTRRSNSGVVSSALLVLALGIAPHSASAGGYSHDIGLRAQGLGGAFRAIADDWSAVAYNPAGLAYIADNHIGVSNGFHHNRFTYTPNFSLSGSSGITPPDAGYLNGQDIPNRHEIGWTPEAALIVRVPVWGESVLGLSIHQTFDQDLDWTLYRGVEGYSTFDFSGLSPQFSIDMDIVNFQATFAREFVEDKFSVGLGLAVVRADLIHRSITLRDNPLPGVVRPFENIPEYTSANGNGWGFGGQLGFLWKPTEKVRVGATFTPKTTVTVSGDVTLDFFLPSDSALRQSEGYLPGSDEFLLTTGFELKAASEFETEVVAPASFGVGVAYELSDKVTVSLDGVYTFWSQYEGFAFTYDTDTSKGFFQYENLTTTDPLELLNPMAKTNLTFPAEWDDAGRAMLGVEYRHSDALSFQFGAGAEQTIIKETTATPLFIDNGPKYTGSFGMQYTINRWDVGFMGQFTTYDDLVVSSPVDVNGDMINDNLPATVSGDVFRSAFGFSYRF